MRRPRTASVIAALVLAAMVPTGLATTSASAQAPAKAGTACKVVGATLKQKKTTLVCRRVGKRLVWRAKPSATSGNAGSGSAAVTTPAVQSGNYSPDNECADIESPRTTYWQVTAGFPRFAERVPSIGTVRVMMLPVDFPDVVATGSPATDMLHFTRALSAIYTGMSDGALTFSFVTQPAYIRVSREAASWGMGSYGGGRGDTFVADVVREVDPVVDFTGVDVVIVMTPPNIRANQIAYSPAMPYPAQAPLVTGEKAIYSSTMTGHDAWADPLTIVHEFGHLLGWTDLYTLSVPAGSSYNEIHRYVGKWDFMGYAWERGVLGWQRFLQGWLTDPEVLCANTTGEFVATLAPLGSPTKTSELMLLRGQSGKLVGVEVRRPGSLDTFVTTNNQGVLIYTIDASGATGEGALRVQGNGISAANYLADAPLKPGQSLTVDGWTISVSSSTNGGDTVRARRE